LGYFSKQTFAAFLTRGEIQHFLYSDNYFPHDTLDLLDDEPEFRAFLSKPFSEQYNFVLSRAIEQRLLPVVEVLFDGRRWVRLEDEDICLEGTLQRVHELVEQMEDMACQSTETKITAARIEDFLSCNSVPEIFNLLPTAFRAEQSKIVATIRQIAIECHNEHDDSKESATILILCKKFQFKDVDLNKRLEDDAKAIEAILKEKEKQKVFANLEYIETAPSLSTTNGIGFQLYGHADYDIATNSFIATYFFVFFFIPIFPIRRYRVSSLAGGYRFFGSLPLSVANKWHIFISLSLLVCIAIGIVVNSESSTSSYSPPSTYNKPSTYNQSYSRGTSTSESQTGYRIPSNITAELDRDSQIIDSEKAKAKQMESQLDNLKQEIEQDGVYLNQESQLDIDEYNSKVDTYNDLLERARSQNRLVNQLVDSYNNKLRQHGR